MIEKEFTFKDYIFSRKIRLSKNHFFITLLIRSLVFVIAGTTGLLITNEILVDTYDIGYLFTPFYMGWLIISISLGYFLEYRIVKMVVIRNSVK